MARIDYVTKEQATDKARDILDKNNWRNIFRMLGHSGSHLHNYCRLGAAIRFKGELDPALREIAITRTGILCHADYEVIAHKRLAAEAGVSPEKIDALEKGQNRYFTHKDGFQFNDYCLAWRVFQTINFK